MEKREEQDNREQLSGTIFSRMQTGEPSGKILLCTNSTGYYQENENHLKELTSKTSVKSVSIQVELHPYISQRELNSVNPELSIITQAWSPVGSAMIYHPEKSSLAHISGHKIIASIAEQQSKFSAQVVS